MSENSKLWYLENLNLFDGMDKDEMEMVEKQTKMKEIEKGQFLYFPEDPSTSIFFLKKGRIKNWKLFRRWKREYQGYSSTR